MRNPFSHETRNLFFYNYSCFWCGQNSWDALHHILGRVSSSPLNASPIHNLQCHIGNHALESFEAKSRLLKQTLKYLLSEDYTLTAEDKQFKETNKKYYA